MSAVSHCAYCGAVATKPKYRFCSAHRYLHRSDANYGGGFSTGGDKPVESAVNSHKERKR